MRDLLRRRDFRLLLAGQTLSMAGDWTLLLVFGIWAKTLTGSSAMAGATIFAMAAPALLTPVGAVVVDRVSRRRLLVVVSAVSSLVVLSLWFVHGRAQLWLLFAVAAYYGLISVVINGAVSALVQEMVPPSAVGTANAMLTTVRQGLRLVAPMIGAGLFAAVGGGWVATLDAVTFVGAAIAMAAIRFPERRRERAGATVRHETVAGLRHVRAEPVLRRAAVVIVVAVGAVGLTESAVFALVDAGLHRPPTFIGVLTTSQGVGAIAAGVVVTTLIARRRAQTVLLAGLVAITVGLVLQASVWFASVLLGFVFVGAALPVVNVGITTLSQQRTPNALMGRVAVAFDVVASAPMTVMIALGALLVGVVPYRALFLTAALGCAVAAMLAVPLCRAVPAGDGASSGSGILPEPDTLAHR